jgi:predicted DNA-binding transcriptional regulator AlpA
MKLITLRELREKLSGRSRSSIHCDVAAGRLPPPIRLGKRAYWNEAAVDARLLELAADTKAKKGT